MNPLMLSIQRLRDLDQSETPPWEDPVSTKMVRVDFAESEHQTIRQVAARLGIPVRHYCHRALVSKATADLQALERKPQEGPSEPRPSPPAAEPTHNAPDAG